MDVIIRSRSVPVSKALQEHCQERAQRAIQPFAQQVDRVELVLVDLNGPKKGLGQACRVFVKLSRGGSVMFATSGRDFYAAASQATFGAGRHLARTLAKARTRTHVPVAPLGAV